MNDLSIGTILFDGVSKRYRLGMQGKLRTTLATLVGNRRDGNSVRNLWALKDVSFRVEPGESLGLIGPNGAGKTTVLKLLSNITQPTSGQIRVSGRTSSLIELGAGFHPELSGRDNIFLNGAILGLKRREIEHRLDDIVSFSELERFIDTPVKRYSSGMYVRLGFAVAAHVEPDILLVDEVLAVGDASFRHRCIQRMRELQTNGTTILFVSHNMHLVRDMCQTALLLHHGQATEYGSASSTISEYERVITSEESHENNTGNLGASSRFSSPTLILSSVEMLPSGADAMLTSDRSARIQICYRSHGRQSIGRIDLRILRQDGTLCCAVDSVGEQDLMELDDVGEIDAIMDPVQLTGGIYHIIVRVTDPSDSIVLASAQSESFTVIANRSVPEPGIFLPKVVWKKSETKGARVK